MNYLELACSNEDCGYSVAVGNGVRSAFNRLTPDECPTCGSDLEHP